MNPHSQAAYDLASQGLVRPEDGHTRPMIYNIKCIDFQLPDFTLGELPVPVEVVVSAFLS